MDLEKIFLVLLILFLGHLAHGEDICLSVNCGSGVCVKTPNPTLPYYCRCSNGLNTILPCPTENSCSRNPCGQGTCEVMPNSLYGYICRCAGDTISLTNCNVTRNACKSNPCLNGLCVEGLTSFICTCLPTWTGRFCHKKINSLCSTSRCEPGKCFPIDDPSFPYICLCPNSQFAMSCWNKIYSSTAAQARRTMVRLSDICRPLHYESCMNGGQCIYSINGYHCLCISGFTGRYCEMKIDRCTSNPCLHGGICYDLQSSYICACPDGIFRSQCLPNAVSSSPASKFSCSCQNGGVCTMMDLQRCTCPIGFTGRFCENLLTTDSCRQVHCMNGGTCYENSTNSFISAYCLCKSGYKGKFCEIEYFRCQSSGRFIDQYNCAKGKYFECIHYQQDGSNSYGTLLSRSCPFPLRFNVLIDRCDYAENVECIEN